MTSNSTHVAAFLAKFPLFLPTVEKLDENDIPWMVGGSGCLFLLGNERLPDDADIFLRDQDHDEADALFSITSFIPEGHTVRNSNPEGNHDIQLTSHLRITEDKEYSLSITDEILSRRVAITADGITIWLLPPEEVLLLKALLRRGPDVGKHDFEDIDAFLQHSTIDREYLKKRIQTLYATERVVDTFAEST